VPLAMGRLFSVSWQVAVDRSHSKKRRIPTMNHPQTTCLLDCLIIRLRCRVVYCGVFEKREKAKD
jgi:hypothetical protein